MSELTFSDLITAAVDYAGGDGDNKALTAARRAVLAAYDQLFHINEWTWYQDYRRLETVAPYSTGEINYNPSTREVTLTGGTWPTWAAYGRLRVSEVDYAVASRTSGTVIVVDAGSPLPSDLDADSSYTLVRDTYPLDDDVVRIDKITSGEFGWDVDVFRAGALPALRRRQSSPARPRAGYYGQYLGGYGVYLWPAPDAIYRLDFMVYRKATPLAVERRERGTVTLTSGSAAVTGAGTDFDSRLVGTVFRVGSNSTDRVGGPTDEFPCVFEARVLSVAGAGSLTLETNSTVTTGGVKYVCSSPADIDRFCVERLLMREIERQMRTILRMKATPTEIGEYQASKAEARGADSRNTGPQVAGGGTGGYPRRLRDYPGGSEFITV